MEGDIQYLTDEQIEKILNRSAPYRRDSDREAYEFHRKKRQYEAAAERNTLYGGAYKSLGGPPYLWKILDREKKIDPEQRIFLPYYSTWPEESTIWKWQWEIPELLRLKLVAFMLHVNHLDHNSVRAELFRRYKEFTPVTYEEWVVKEQMRAMLRQQITDKDAPALKWIPDKTLNLTEEYLTWQEKKDDAILATVSILYDDSAVNAIITELSDATPAIRVSAAKKMAKMRMESDHYDPTPIDPAKKNLAEVRLGKVIDALINSLATDKEAVVKKEAMQSLIVQGNVKAIPALIAALKDANVGVRAAAATSLGTKSFVDKTAFQPLLDTLVDEAGVVSANVALSLEAYKDKDAIKPLQKALGNDYNLTRCNAIKSLYAIGGDKVMDIIGNILNNLR